jgi:hypothetical protein
MFARAALLVVVTFAALISPPHAPAQDLAHRLILKDGSYQLVTKYEVKGDRVRYYSAEREEWEEMPTSLVDWPATDKFEKDRAAGQSVPEAAQFDKDLEQERAEEEAQRPQVAPGLRLPEASGVFLLDTFQGMPQLNEIQQTAGDVNRNTKGNIFRGAINPVASNKQIIEIEGAHAPIQAHVDVPSLYINVEETPGQEPAASEPTGSKSERPEKSSSEKDSSHNGPQQPQQPQQARVPFDRYMIVKTEVKGGKRIVGDVKRAVTGKVSQEQHSIKTTITRVTGGWLKVTPTESLAPGEYALVEMMGKEGMNLYVWDFGVNPKAPANANPWKPEARDATKSDAAK